MKAQRLSLIDRISTLPQSLIENILCLVPIKDAAKTSVLSREWRSKWITIPKLIFSEYTFEFSTDANQLSEERYLDMASQRKMMTRRCKLFYAIFQVLLVHQGPIHEFDLSINGDATCVEVDRIILYLARNTSLKKVTLNFTFPRYKIPLSFFSLHHLTDLNLSGCHIVLQPVSSRFSSLKRLCLSNVKISTKTLLDFVSSCSLLTSFTLDEECNHIVSDDDSTLIELFKYLPMIEDLTISYWIFQCFVEDSYQRGFRSSLDHLKYFCVEGLFFTSRNDLLFILSLIRCSPNLEKLKLYMFAMFAELEEESCWNYDIDFVTREDYSDILLENLNELEIDNFGNLKPELDLVKLILAKSPMLKKVSLFPYDKVTKDEEMSVLGILLHSPPASPMVEIIVKYEDERPW